MRCTACNKLLSDREATRKHGKTKEYLDLCDSCLGTVSEIARIPLYEPEDLDVLDLTGIDLDEDEGDPKELRF